MSAICSRCGESWAGFDWEQDEPPCYCGHDPRITRATPAPRVDIGGENGLTRAWAAALRLIERGESDMTRQDVSDMVSDAAWIRGLPTAGDCPLMERVGGVWAK